MDVLAVREACDEIVRYVRQGSGPVLLEARCYRYQGHSMTDAGKYRSVAETELWKKRDPIPRLAKSMLEQGIVDAARLEGIETEVNEVVVDAMAFAEQSPAPLPEALYQDLFVENDRA
jgi:pyruvate dehydrogenase E1 component alpha subunit